VAGQADAFKGGVERPFDDGVICEGGNHIRRDGFAAGKVNDLNGSAVNAVGKQQDFKDGRLHIAVNSAFGKVLIAVGFDVD